MSSILQLILFDFYGFAETKSNSRDFVRYFLGPALASSNITNRIQLMGLDDGRIMLPAYADTVSIFLFRQDIVLANSCGTPDRT